tara:strand:- start:1087 stop:1656 length:570 start_codon:yes stop_codon:yes gene_type:complete
MNFKKLIFLIFFCSSLELFSEEMSQELVDALETCNSCHGKEVLADNPEVPVITGQSLQYIYRQLKDYKSNSRAHEIMSSMVSDLEKKILLELATHFSEQKWIDFRTDSEFDETLALDMIASGQCSQCHGTFKENNLAAPRLAGQKESYLIATMTAFKKRTRLNAPDKSSLFETISEEQIKALSGYIANK